MSKQQNLFYKTGTKLKLKNKLKRKSHWYTMLYISTVIQTLAANTISAVFSDFTAPHARYFLRPWGMTKNFW